MEKNFCVEIVGQCGGVFITHPNIQAAKEWLAEIVWIPNARESFKALGAEKLKIIIKLDRDVGVCVGYITLDPRISIESSWECWEAFKPSAFSLLYGGGMYAGV